MPYPQLLIDVNDFTHLAGGQYVKIWYTTKGLARYWYVHTFLVENGAELLDCHNAQVTFNSKNEMFSFLDGWISNTVDWYDQYILMTKEVALQILPFMCQPRVPFEAGILDEEIKRACETFAFRCRDVLAV